MKHATGNITVRIEKTALDTYSLSVLDDGPGLPVGFEAAKSKGLGMKLILRFVKQIGGDLQIIPRDDGHRTCFTVTFAGRPIDGWRKADIGDARRFEHAPECPIFLQSLPKGGPLSPTVPASRAK